MWPVEKFKTFEPMYDINASTMFLTFQELLCYSSIRAPLAIEIFLNEFRSLILSLRHTLC